MECVLFMEGGQDCSPGGFCRWGNSCKKSKEGPTSLMSPGNPGKSWPCAHSQLLWEAGQTGSSEPWSTGHGQECKSHWDHWEEDFYCHLIPLPSLPHKCSFAGTGGTSCSTSASPDVFTHQKVSGRDLQVIFYPICSYRAIMGSRSKRKIHLLALLLIQHPKREANMTFLWWPMAALLHVWWRRWVLRSFHTVPCFGRECLWSKWLTPMIGRNLPPLQQLLLSKDLVWDSDH